MSSAPACSTTRSRRRTTIATCSTQLRARNLFMMCANPDVVVERGDRLVYCAGAIADAYAALGGEVYYAGKPHRPLYELALAETAKARARALAPADVPLNRVLAIGDSVRTDLKGAHDLGVDCLFVTAGIHAEELGHRDDPDLAALGDDVRGRRSGAQGGDEKIDLVRGGAGSAEQLVDLSGRRCVPNDYSANTASILVLSVCALNGLTM